ncbi:MAG: nicotinamide riboside transporter PnuC [Pseudomonadales bacterium]
MLEILAAAGRQLQQNSVPELIAVLLAIVYLVLAVKEKIACWYAAFASTFIFLIIFWNVNLYMEAMLQIYYLAMAVYGWYQWTHPGSGKTQLPVSTWSLRQHALALSIIGGATVISGYYLSAYSDQHLPYVDSFTTWGGVVTTVMVARKILENWIYWLVIDGVSIFLYLDRELYFTALLFCAYIVIIFFGWYRWMKTWRAQATA